MRTSAKYALLGLLLFACQNAFAQPPAGLRTIIAGAETKCQACTDAGNNSFVDCELTHRKTVDSVLNVIYDRLKKQMNPNSFTVLKKDELAWIKKRDQYLRKEAIDQQNDDVEASVKNALLIHKEALYTADRAKYLLSLLR